MNKWIVNRKNRGDFNYPKRRDNKKQTNKHYNRQPPRDPLYIVVLDPQNPSKNQQISATFAICGDHKWLLFFFGLVWLGLLSIWIWVKTNNKSPTIFWNVKITINNCIFSLSIRFFTSFWKKVKIPEGSASWMDWCQNSYTLRNSCTVWIDSINLINAIEVDASRNPTKLKNL